MQNNLVNSVTNTIFNISKSMEKISNLDDGSKKIKKLSSKFLLDTSASVESLNFARAVAKLSELSKKGSSSSDSSDDELLSTELLGEEENKDVDRFDDPVTDSFHSDFSCTDNSNQESVSCETNQHKSSNITPCKVVLVKIQQSKEDNSSSDNSEGAVNDEIAKNDALSIISSGNSTVNSIEKINQVNESSKQKTVNESSKQKTVSDSSEQKTVNGRGLSRNLDKENFGSADEESNMSSQTTGHKTDLSKRLKILSDSSNSSVDLGNTECLTDENDEAMGKIQTENSNLNKSVGKELEETSYLSDKIDSDNSASSVGRELNYYLFPLEPSPAKRGNAPITVKRNRTSELSAEVMQICSTEFGDDSVEKTHQGDLRNITRPNEISNAELADKNDPQDKMVTESISGNINDDENLNITLRKVNVIKKCDSKRETRSTPLSALKNLSQKMSSESSWDLSSNDDNEYQVVKKRKKLPKNDKSNKKKTPVSDKKNTFSSVSSREKRLKISSSTSVTSSRTKRNYPVKMVHKNRQLQTEDAGLESTDDSLPRTEVNSSDEFETDASKKNVLKKIFTSYVTVKAQSKSLQSGKIISEKKGRKRRKRVLKHLHDNTDLDTFNDVDKIIKKRNSTIWSIQSFCSEDTSNVRHSRRKLPTHFDESNCLLFSKKTEINTKFKQRNKNIIVSSDEESNKNVFPSVSKQQIHKLLAAKAQKNDSQSFLKLNKPELFDLNLIYSKIFIDNVGYINISANDLFTGLNLSPIVLIEDIFINVLKGLNN